MRPLLKSSRPSAKNRVKNRSSSPSVVFFDTLGSLLGQNHPRTRPLTLESIEEMDSRNLALFIKDRFADAGDFVFLFVGNIDFETMEPLVKRYLGSLPALDRKESWKDIGLHPPRGLSKNACSKAWSLRAR